MNRRTGKLTVPNILGVFVFIVLVRIFIGPITKAVAAAWSSSGIFTKAALSLIPVSFVVLPVILIFTLQAPRRRPVSRAAVQRRRRRQ